MPKEIHSPKQDPSAEQIIHIPLAKLHSFPDHPYGIREDQAMLDTLDSVKQNGVIVPAIVRPKAEGGYEIVAGHRRKLASEQAGFTDMPCIVRNLTDDEAIIQLVDSNAQREDVLPSERAKAPPALKKVRRSSGPSILSIISSLLNAVFYGRSFSTTRPGRRPSAVYDTLPSAARRAEIRPPPGRRRFLNDTSLPSHAFGSAGKRRTSLLCGS